MEAPYNAERTRLTVETYLELDAAQNILARQAPHNFRSVSGLVRIEDPANTSRFTHFFHDGLNVSSVESSQPRFLPEMIWTIHRACEPSNFPGEGLPPPLVTLSEPVHGETFENPAAINTAWNIEWVRFDGKPYSSNFPPGWTPNGVPVAFNAKFSADNEKTWKFINTGAEALLGVHNSGQNVTSGVAWDVSGLPDGNYVFRLEGFTNRALHYAFHNARVRIKR
jgi:hypothetical protein